MLNKLQFNNMVISNKKGIQQARIQTINKLVHKIRKLKTLLEKRPEDNKCKERIRKSTETMDQLKKFKPVDLMKMVLLLEKPPAAVITNGLSSPDEMAIALLAMNKVMEGLIKRFKTELKLLDAANSTWRDELREDSKRKQKIERTEEKKRKRTALKEQKAIERKRHEWLEQNLQDGKTGEEPKELEENVSTVSGWKVEEIDEPKVDEVTENNESNPPIISQQFKSPAEDKINKRVRKETQKKQKIEIKTQHISKEVTESIESTPPPICQQLKRPVEDKTNKKVRNEPPKKQKIETKTQIKKFEENQSSAEEEEIDNSEESPAETHVVDPFFVTETGENYLSTAVSNRAQYDVNDRDDQKDLHMIKLNGSKTSTNYRERKQQQQNDKYPQRQNKWNDDKFSQRQNKWNDDKYPQRQNKWNDDKYPQKQNNWNKQGEWKKQNEGGEARQQKSNNPTPKTEEKLHPSWAAKLKQKPVITSFQGKKIIFGDGDSIKEISSNTTNNTKNTRKDQPSQNINTDSLHPSWAAKQKQKPIIAAFQGKKISFANDDE